MSTRPLVFHGAIALLVGLAAGVPFAIVSLRDAGADAVRAWRVAHEGGVTIGIALIALGAAGPRLRWHREPARAWRWSLVLASYSFVFGATLAAATGARRLAPGGSALDRLVFAAYAIGTIAMFVGTVLTIHAARNDPPLSG